MFGSVLVVAVSASFVLFSSSSLDWLWRGVVRRGFCYARGSFCCCCFLWCVFSRLLPGRDLFVVSCGWCDIALFCGWCLFSSCVLLVFFRCSGRLWFFLCFITLICRISYWSGLGDACWAFWCCGSYYVSQDILAL